MNSISKQIYIDNSKLIFPIYKYDHILKEYYLETLQKNNLFKK